MSKFISSKLFTSLLLVILTMLGVGTVSFSYAQPQICGNGGTGYCMNDWNNGTDVKMYYGNSSNEDFQVISVDPCHDGGTVSSNLFCPFNVFAMDQEMNGDPLIRIEYMPKGQCIGTNGSGYGVLTSCGDAYGSGAGNGVIMAWYRNSSVPGLLVNRYWSNQYNNYIYTCSGGAVGAPLDVAYGGSYQYGGCNWGGL